MIYKASRSISMSLLVLLLCCSSVQCVFSCIGPISDCDCPLTLDSLSTTTIQSCNHTSITAYLNLTTTSNQVLVIPQLTYYNASLNESVKVKFDSTFLNKNDVLHLNPSLHSSVTKYTMVFCYENVWDLDKFVLNPVSCLIDKEEYSDEIPQQSSSSLVWASSSVMFPDVVSQHISPRITTGQPSVSSQSPVGVTYNTTTEYRTPPTTTTTQSSISYNRMTNITTPTSTINMTTVLNTGAPVSEMPSASSNVVTILIATIFICVTVIIISVFLSLCIIKLTKRSRKLSINPDDDSSYGRTSGMDRDIYSSAISLSSSIVTTLAPLDPSPATPTSYDHNTHNIEDHSDIKCIKVLDTSAPNIIYTVTDDLRYVPASRRSNPSILTSSTSGISEESDTSNSTAGWGAIPHFEMDKISEFSVVPRSESSCGGSVAGSISLPSLEFEIIDTNVDRIGTGSATTGTRGDATTGTSVDIVEIVATDIGTGTTGTFTDTSNDTGISTTGTTTGTGSDTSAGIRTGTIVPNTGHQHNRQYFRDTKSPQHLTTNELQDRLPKDSNAIYIVLTDSSTRPGPSHVSSLYEGSDPQQEQQLPTYIRVKNQTHDNNNEFVINNDLLGTAV